MHASEQETDHRHACMQKKNISKHNSDHLPFCMEMINKIRTGLFEKQQKIQEQFISIRDLLRIECSLPN